MAVADEVSRRRFGNQAMLLGQIGIETAPCPGNCGFCVFGEGHTTFGRTKAHPGRDHGEGSGFHDGRRSLRHLPHDDARFRFRQSSQHYQNCPRCTPQRPQIVVNIGDFDHSQAEQLRAAGIQGAYHVCNFREGVDTALSPEQRKKTFQTIREASLDFYYCCEPIGPEHTPEELVEQMFLGIEYGCFQHAARRRVWVPGLPVSRRGQITELRLAQVVAVVADSPRLGCRETQNIAVHEPNLLGLTCRGKRGVCRDGCEPSRHCGRHRHQSWT